MMRADEVDSRASAAASPWMPVPQTLFAFATIAMGLVAQVAEELASRGTAPRVFVSPKVPGIAADNNAQVFAVYQRSLER